MCSHHYLFLYFQRPSPSSLWTHLLRWVPPMDDEKFIIPMELFGVLGNGCNVCFVLTNVKIFSILAQIFVMISMNGQNVIHLTTCVEHYVAVLHPVQYLKSKKPCNIRIRNISTVCFWAILITGCFLTVQYIHLEQYEIYVAILLLGFHLLSSAASQFSAL